MKTLDTMAISDLKVTIVHYEFTLAVQLQISLH